MYHQFNIQQFYVLLTQCIYVFCVDLRTNSDYFPISPEMSWPSVALYGLLNILPRKWDCNIKTDLRRRGREFVILKWQCWLSWFLISLVTAMQKLCTISLSGMSICFPCLYRSVHTQLVPQCAHKVSTAVCTQSLYRSMHTKFVPQCAHTVSTTVCTQS